MRLPKSRAAIRIEQYCKRRKDRMKPKWQEDSSCVFAYYFCRGTCHRRDTAGKERAPKSIRRRSGKRSFVKAVRTIRQENRSQSAAPVIRGIAHSSMRYRMDHRTPAEPSAAEFSGMVSATAPSEQGTFVPCGSVLTWHK